MLIPLRSRAQLLPCVIRQPPRSDQAITCFSQKQLHTLIIEWVTSQANGATRTLECFWSLLASIQPRTILIRQASIWCVHTITALLSIFRFSVSSFKGLAMSSVLFLPLSEDVLRIFTDVWPSLAATRAEVISYMCERNRALKRDCG